MRKLLFLLLLVTTIAVIANPTARMIIATKLTSVPMLSEDVEVTLASDSGHVSGVFKFALDDKKIKKNSYVDVWVPVIVKKGSIDPRKTLDYKYEKETHLVAAIGKTGRVGEPVHPRNPMLKDHPAVPSLDDKGLDILWFTASPEYIKRHKTIRVRYHQPLIDGVFYYLPIITGDREKEKDSSNFRIVIHSEGKMYPAEGTKFKYNYNSDKDMVITPENGVLIGVTGEFSSQDRSGGKKQP